MQVTRLFATIVIVFTTLVGLAFGLIAPLFALIIGVASAVAMFCSAALLLDRVIDSRYPIELDQIDRARAERVAADVRRSHVWSEIVTREGESSQVSDALPSNPPGYGLSAVGGRSRRARVDPVDRR